MHSKVKKPGGCTPGAVQIFKLRIFKMNTLQKRHVDAQAEMGTARPRRKALPERMRAYRIDKWLVVHSSSEVRHG